MNPISSRLAFALLAVSAGQALADTPALSPAETIETLTARIKALEANAESLRQQTAEAMALLQATKAEIEQMKVGQTEALAAAPAAMAPEPLTDTSGSSGPNAFNPAISVILNGAYAHHSLDPDSYQRAGFPVVGEGGPSAQGIALGESEISLAANIDEKFYGQVTLAIGSEDGNTELGVEEAYISTTSLPAGLILQAGRFFSNIGYLNVHHAHTDKFADRPLAYQAFVGNQYGDDGVQLRWVAPTDLYVEVGGEILRGQNFPSGGAGHSGAGVKTLFVHSGGDIGIESAWLAGVSMLKSSTAGAEDGFSGDNTLYVADATWKWAPQGNFKDGGVTVRGEYFLDDRDGDYIDPVDDLLTQSWQGQRRGAYIEGIYRINRNWETGYRYDRLWADAEGPYASSFDPDRHSAMLTWINSEFSLVRLQYSHDRPNPTASDNALTLQYQVSLGAHGAHKF